MRYLLYIVESTFSFLISQLLKIEGIREYILEKLSNWTEEKGLKYGISFRLQPKVAELTGGCVCMYCNWAIEPNDQHGYCEMILKLDGMSDEDLLSIWKALDDYNSDEMYDEKSGISMDEWANAVYAEISKRELDWISHEAQSVQFPECPYCEGPGRVGNAAPSWASIGHYFYCYECGMTF